jgi:hypothetical protein
VVVQKHLAVKTGVQVLLHLHTDQVGLAVRRLAVQQMAAQVCKA